MRLDLWSARVIVWAATAGRDAVLTPDAHLYFFDRYRRLAELHRVRGHLRTAGRLREKAAEHLRNSGGDGPPYAAAMAMPKPRSFVRVDAVSRVDLDGPDEAA